MDSLELLDFSSFIIFSDDPWSLLISFRQLFKLPLVVQCCDVICEWPLKTPVILHDCDIFTFAYSFEALNGHKMYPPEILPLQ